MVISTERLQQYFIAYYGRPANNEGLQYWQSINFDSEAALVWNFGNRDQPEFVNLYGTEATLTPSNFINAVFNNLFGRDVSTTTGLNYWLGEYNKYIAMGEDADTVRGKMVTWIMDGATGADLIALNKKLAVAIEFTDALNLPEEILAYENNLDVGRDLLTTVGATTDVEAIDIDAIVLEMVGDSEVIPGETFVLTTNVDNVVAPDVVKTDTVKGVVDGDQDGDTAGSTFSSGDFIQGNGKTILDLSVAEAGDARFATVNDVAQVNLLAGTDWYVNFNAADWNNIGSVNLNNGLDGLDVFFDNLESGVDMSISNVSGWMSASFTNDSWAGLWSGPDGSLAWVDGAVVGSAVTGESVGFSFSSWKNDQDVTFGDVSLIGTDASEAWFSVSATADKAGDVTIGNVTITGFTDDIWLEIDNTDHTADSDAANTTLGNVTLAALNSGSISASIEQTGYNQLGNVAVGNVDLSVGDDGYGYFYVENYGYYDGAADDVTVGDVTIGDVAVDVGMSATMYVSVSHSAYADDGSATVGALQIGNMSATLAQNAWGSFEFSHSAWASGSGDATVGATTIGDVTLNLATDASFSVELEVSAYSSAGGTATVGDVTVGNLVVDQGVNSDVWESYEIDANASATQAIVSDVTFGDVTINANDGAYNDYSVSISSDGDIGNIEFGDLTVNGGVDADIYNYRYAWAENDIASLVVGDIDVVMDQSGYFYGSLSMSAISGEFGDVSIGDVSLAAATSAYAEYSIELEGETGMGNVTVGDVSLSAAENASVSLSASFSNDGTDAIGDVTFGNVAMTADGANADAYFYAFVGDAATAGTLTFGDFDLSVDNTVATAVTNWASITVDVSNSLSDLVIGDINLSTSTVLAATTDRNYVEMDYYAYADGDLTVGDISVSGGDGSADNFATLTSWLNLSAGGDINIGSIDYSAYGADATIDVSGYKTTGAIIGSGFDDTITDNDGANAMTGGAGADMFILQDTNTGKTLDTLDQILDFANTAGDKIDLSVAVNIGNYSEGAYADFSTFKTEANNADKAVFVGSMTGVDGVVAAVDYNVDGTVDFMLQLVGVNLAGVDVASFV